MRRTGGTRLFIQSSGGKFVQRKKKFKFLTLQYVVSNPSHPTEVVAL
jgi:hypothetical protein